MVTLKPAQFLTDVLALHVPDSSSTTRITHSDCLCYLFVLIERPVDEQPTNNWDIPYQAAAEGQVVCPQPEQENVKRCDALPACQMCLKGTWEEYGNTLGLCMSVFGWGWKQREPRESTHRHFNTLQFCLKTSYKSRVLKAWASHHVSPVWFVSPHRGMKTH